MGLVTDERERERLCGKQACKGAHAARLDWVHEIRTATHEENTAQHRLVV